MKICTEELDADLEKWDRMAEAAYEKERNQIVRLSVTRGRLQGSAVGFFAGIAFTVLAQMLLE